MNFAILTNNTVKTFTNNVILFPTSVDDQFVLTRTNTSGTISYSWSKPLEGLASLDFITTNNTTYITTNPQTIDITGDVLVFDILIQDIPLLCNMNRDIIITVNHVEHKITPWIKYQQIVVDNDQKTVIISSNVENNVIMLQKIHRL